MDLDVNPLANFRDSLFWDTNPNLLSAEKDAQFIIGRVLDFGNLKEWRLTERLYGKEKIIKVAIDHIFTDPRSANFWALVLSIPANKIKCTRNPSLKIPNTFLNY
jgi:hypothetical protein